MRATRMAGLLATGGLILGFAAGPAVADPLKGEIIPLDCDNGKTYTVVLNGNGAFTPGHDADSNSMLVPVEFGAFTGTVTDAQGNVVDQIDDPALPKGNSAKGKKDLVTCEFSFSGTEDGLTFNGSGSVTGFITPAKG